MAEQVLTGVPAGFGCISKLTTDDGDFRVTWNPGDPDDVANARQAFADLRRAGYGTYKIEDRGRKRTEIREFDPAAGAMQIVAHRPNRGG
jgi:hypothetical protein